MIPVVFDKNVYLRCTNKEIVYLRKNIEEMAVEWEKTDRYFLPWPPKEDDNKMVEITYVMVEPDKHDPNKDKAVMVTPRLEKNSKIWHVSMKPEHIKLQVIEPVQDGHIV